MEIIQGWIGYGSLLGCPWLGALGAGGVALGLGFLGAPFWMWSVVLLISLWAFAVPAWTLLLAVAALAVFNVPALRRILVTSPLMKGLAQAGIIPAISETERVALEAGSIWVDGEFFSGKPNFKRLMSEPYPKLNAEEQAFLDGPTEELCRRIQDWKLYQEKEIPEDAWKFMKEQRFLGMIIPKEYGGLGFSAIAHSEVISKLASRSIPIAITCMVPNSLGPAELLAHYGTQAQKDYYLPRLAKGIEIPCFGLTEPQAGSDAGSITSEAVVFRGDDGKLYLRLSWNKRYITLAAISTIIGLAVQLKDPENLLGKGTELGITCILVPSETRGVVLGRRHNPMGIPFYNCPTEGRDVVVSVDQIIGGISGAGMGWKMLMECLAAGRSISLPAQGAGLSKLTARVVGNYALVRRQFGVSIGRFEGIEEPLARIGSLTYLIEALRIYTCGAVDSGMKPSVVSAIAKYNATEIARRIINDGMDVLGGAGISRGPRNLLANAYLSMPISITVEGANILTRTLIIFGQGAIRCHPYAYPEVKALMAKDAVAFDSLFFKHIGFVVRNLCRAVFFSLTRGLLVRSPVNGPTTKYFRKLGWASASFAFLTDVALGCYGGGLKTKEKITGRFADILSGMYLATAVLRRFEAEGRPKEELPFVHFALQTVFTQMQEAFDGLFANFSVPGLAWLFKGPVALWSRLNPLARFPKDGLGHSVVHLLQTQNAAREALSRGIYMPSSEAEPLCKLEKAFELSLASAAIVYKMHAAVKKKALPRLKGHALIEAALKSQVITAHEGRILEQAEQAQNEAIQVDSFELEAFHTGLLEDPVALPQSSGRALRA